MALITTNRYEMKRFILLISCMLFATHVLANSISSVRLWRAPDHTRLVFDLDSPIDYKLISLAEPDRLVLDISDTTLGTSLDDIELTNTPIVKIRYAGRNNNDLRVVLDLNNQVQPRSFLLKPNGDAGHRLVVDLNDIEGTAVVSEPARDPKLDEKRNVVVAIDAGHGGEDPGASGPTKSREKHVVLAIAKVLAEEINAQPGFEAVLVRKGDYYIKHKRRWEIARESRADLFISVHADAFTDPRAKGSSVYALSRKGTTSAMARFLADSENVDLAGEVNLGDQEEMVAKTLTDLVMTSSLVTSLDIGERIIGAMGKVTHMHSKRVELANFRVLKAPDIPSLLVETGFISNPSEEKKLNSSNHQKKLAKAITSGLKAYFESNPPMGTLLAWQREASEKAKHVVVRGDSLTSIASRYGVSMAALKKANNLNSNTIRIGQTLRIPSS
jgi:N-acetylmuramoyl-L-alanine amidase